jgi:SAM-dependent methyltransferase
LKADYERYDDRYRRLRAAGNPGWEDDAEHERSLELLARFIAWDEVPRGGRALELGCGDGRKSLWLARRGWDVTGIDISPTAIGWARDKAAEASLTVDFRVGSVLDLAELADADFDFVLDGHCAHGIIGADRSAFFGSARRVLRPAGAFLLMTMCGEPPASKVAQFQPHTRCVFTNGVPTRYLGQPAALLRELDTAGFHVVRAEVVPRLDAGDCDELAALATLP